MTDRPASWRMPTPKQMEKLAAELARRPGPTAATPDEPLPTENWGSVLKDPPAAATGTRQQRLSEIQRHVLRISPSLRTNRGNPDCRCSPTVWQQRSLEGRGAAVARPYLPAAHRQARRRRVLAGIRDTVVRSG